MVCYQTDAKGREGAELHKGAIVAGRMLLGCCHDFPSYCGGDSLKVVGLLGIRNLNCN